MAAAAMEAADRFSEIDLMKTLFRAALLGSAVLAAGAVSASAQNAAAVHPGPHQPGGHVVTMAEHGPFLNLTAYGETKAAPDMASIITGVMTEAPTAAEAMRQNRDRMNRVVAALRAQGIAEKDIQTSGLNLNPQYDYVENQPPKLRGYQASNQVTVIVYDLAKIGQAADAVVAAGANQINGVSFGLRDPQTAENAARREAVAALKAKADLYAQATGHRIKSLRGLSEGGGYQPTPPMPMMYARAAVAEMKDSTSVSPGQLTLRVEIQGTYELEK